MSLILDALRKADAERERGAVPGLHAHPAELGEVDAPAPARTPPWLWAGLGIAVGGVTAIALAAWVIGRSEPAPAIAPLPSAAPPPTASTPSAPAVPVPAPAATQMPPLVAEPAPWPASDGRKSGERAGAARSDATPAAPLTLTAEPAVVAFEQLPAHIRGQLPPLSFGGSIYSSNAASRSLIVNGRLHREGEEVAPGLTLEQIKPKGAVFGFRGTRFEVLL